MVLVKINGVSAMTNIPGELCINHVLGFEVIYVLFSAGHSRGYRMVRGDYLLNVVRTSGKLSEEVAHWGAELPRGAY